MIIFKPHEALSVIKRYLPKNPVIIEAGAFDGNDTQRMAQLWPQGLIHSFEPVPQLFNRLQKKTQHFDHVHCYAYALSNQNGNAYFHIAEKPTRPGVPSQASSLREPKERLKHSPMQFPYTIVVPTITLDYWMQQQQVCHVDFLWLDVQGHELTVLQAGQQLLSTVMVVFTEVGFFENYVGQPNYIDLQQWLEQQGFFLIGRDFMDMKNSFFGNLLFIRK